MKPVLCYFPAPAQGWESVNAPKGTWVKEQVQKAIDGGHSPALLPSTGLERLPVAFPASTATLIEDMAGELDVAPGRLVGMLIQALRNAQSIKEHAQETQKIEPRGIDRPEQRKALDAVLPLLDQGRIALVEVGTGVGKSRLAGRISQHLASKGKPVRKDDASQEEPLSHEEEGANHERARQVVVATPTVSQCIHLLKEYESLTRALEESDEPNRFMPAPALFLGRGNFVDLELAEEAAAQISEKSSADVLLKWLRDGAPAGFTEAARALAKTIPGICGLMEDWKWLISTIDLKEEDQDIQECELTDESSEKSSQWYATLKERARASQVIICTHAMLAVDAITRLRNPEGILGWVDDLIIDEAHQFEQEMANIASQGVSLSTLSATLKKQQWSALRCKSLADSAANKARDLNRALTLLPMKSGTSIIVPDSLRNHTALARAWVETLPIMQDLVDELKRISAAIYEAKDVSGWKLAQMRINKAIRAFSFALAGTHTVEVSLSKVIRMTTMQVGPRTVSQYLKPLWDRSTSVTLMSATLYVPTLQGDSPSYIMQTLALPQDRVAQTPSIQPGWITSSTELRTPTGSAVAKLTPPKADTATHEEMLAWIDQVSLCISTCIAPAAAGGTLVLMSGYDRLEYLADILRETLGDRLITQSRSGHGLSRAIQSFREAHARGDRPVLLATGGAWTGLDIKDLNVPDDRAQDDLLLTDLVIPNMPFGLNRTTTHAHRTQSFFGFESSATILLLRQGLGRLIRRPGLERRKIWVLDGRLLRDQSGTQARGAYARCLAVLEVYRRRRPFDF